MTELKVGVAGLGHGTTLLGANNPEATDLPMRVTAICETNPDVLEKTAHENEIAFSTEDYDELVARDDLDVIGIYTPGPLHAEQILKALAADKHVMVTKSMVYTMEEAEAIVETVDRTGLVLLVTQTMRGRSDLMEAKRVCDAGEIGELFLGEAHYIHDLRPVYDYSPWRLTMPQDLILGGGCHPIDMLRWFFGDIEEVHCYGLRSGVAEEYPQEDNFVINVRFTNGAIGRVAAYLGMVHPPGVPGVSLTVYGTKGTIRDNCKTLDPNDLRPKSEHTTIFPDAQGHYGEMQIMMRHMAKCILEDETPWVGVREGARIVATGLACWESLRSGLPAKVRNDF